MPGGGGIPGGSGIPGGGGIPEQTHYSRASTRRVVYLVEEACPVVGASREAEAFQEGRPSLVAA